ncbi:MAG: fumarylacetoacetate hydrolase family protein [Rhodospirillaceae bacterium]|jgi:2-keto-4-pentenoate hydratase/2-oxohepta-3-ene-1,7-dioic acid hydratase in catechol pathway|nr:fumarylacetoacetate hydrolase family protein [Rhodospirillaceae bacterium]MBT5458134.1 fumarylacetoacetate hydrolase family protein [Rhodospirillaceae bacterium]
MKICRFDDNRLGLVDGDTIIDVTAAIDVLPALRWSFPMGDPLILHWDAILPAIEAAAPSGTRHKLDEVRLLSPIANPGKIIGIAGNRKNRHSEKLDFGPGVPVGTSRNDGDPARMFIKANSALVGPSDGVALRFLDRRNDPEAEFTIIIGRTCTDITVADALDYIVGYCIGMDMTLRGAESASSRKSIDGYAVLGPWMVTADEIPDPDNISIALSVNGESLQDSNTSDMMFGIAEVVAHASTFYTLHPGDVIMAGSPLGFEPVVPGDVMVADFERIGRMEIRARAHGA